MPALVVLVVLALLGVASHPTSAAAPNAPRPEQLRDGLLGDAEQVIIVSSTTWASTTATLSLYEQRPGGWVRLAGPYTARLGRNGVSVDHVEGDGTTPAGSHRLISAFGRRTKSPTKLPYRTVQYGDCWISDVESDNYNEWVEQIPCGSRNKNLWAIARAGAYANAIVTDYNMNPIVVGKGSAIFVHVHARTKSGATKATSGCVSVRSSQLLTLLARLDPAKQPRIVIGPSAWLRNPSLAFS